MLKEKKLSFIFECDGNKVDLSSFDYGIISVDGIESSDFENYSSANSFYDGCTIYKTRIKERYISLKFEYIKENDKEEKRQELIRFFNPFLPGTLTVKYENIERVIEYKVEKLSMKINNVNDLLNVTVDLICPNPYWTEPDRIVNDIAYWQGTFEFPLEIDTVNKIEFGRRNDSLIANIENVGDVECGFIVEFKAQGTVKNPSLLNVMTREFIKVNRTMKAGEVITVDTRFNKKKVISRFEGDETNILNFIDLNSTFMQLDKGDNYFKYEAEENISNLEIKIVHNNWYLGV